MREILCDAVKKILILYASAGHGHQKAAMAVEAVFRARGYKTIDCVDVLERTILGFGERYRSLYLFLIRHVPWLWGFFYYLTDLRLIYLLVRPLRRLVNHVFAGRVEKMVLDRQPDIVVSTHFLSTEAVGHLKKKGRTQARLITVVTDYLAHWFWISSQSDVYCAASEETAADLERRGIPPERIAVTGIPIEDKFSQTITRDAARGSLGLDPDRFTVLLTSGGAGVGLVEPLTGRLSILEPSLQVLVVCGTNEALKRRLDSKHRDRDHLRLYGFVNNIHELMAACDLVVGKGGGLTVTESLAMEKPMVLIGALPGQETRNVRVASRRKAASVAHSIAQAVVLVQRYQKDPVFYAQTLEAIRSMRRLCSAEAVVSVSVGNE